MQTQFKLAIGCDLACQTDIHLMQRAVEDLIIFVLPFD